MARRGPSRRPLEADLLLSHTWDMVYRHDLKGVMTYVSPSIERISGYTVKEWMRHYSTFMTNNPVNETVRDYTEDTLRTGRRHPPYLVEIRRKDGKPVLLEISERAYRVRGRIAGIIGVGRDVTEREHAGAELQRLVGCLSRSNQDLAEFASFASHDLQGPLLKVAAHARLLKAQGERLGGEARVHADAIAEEVARLQALVGSLLAYAHAGAEELQAEPVALRAVFDAAMGDLKKELAETGAKLRTGALPVVLGQALSLQRVLVNLLGNSLKHRGRKTPAIRVETAKEGPKWRVTVRDNGVGIPAGKHEEAFLPFRRLRRGGPPGSGIGLAICRRIVERHGGRIWAEPNPGGGTAVHFTLPAA